MTDLERARLAKVLRVDPAQLSCVEPLDAQDLRRLRESISRGLSQADRGVAGRLAAGTQLLPPPILAKIAERVLPPVATARVAAQMPPERCAAVSERLPISYMADVCVELDQPTAETLMSRLPPRIIVDVAHELIERAEYPTIGLLVGAAEEALIRTVLASISDSDVLLKISFYVEPPEVLARMRDVLADTWPEQGD
jgi:hypothetical protein